MSLPQDSLAIRFGSYSQIEYVQLQLQQNQNNTLLTGCRNLQPLVSNDSNSLNPCFISLVYGCFALLFALLGSYQLTQSIFQRPKLGPVLERANDHIKLMLNLLQAVLFIFCFSSLLVDYQAHTFQFINYWASIIVFTFIIVPLDSLQPRDRICSSATTVLYYPLQTILFFIVFVQQTFGSHQVISSHTPLESIFSFTLILISSLLTYLEYYHYQPNDELLGYYETNGMDTDTPTIVSKLTFTWMNKMIMTGYQNNGLEQENLPLPPSRVTTSHSAPVLTANWQNQLNKHKSNPKSKPSLLIALARSYGWPILMSFFFDMANSFVAFIQPQLLKQLIRFFGRTDNPPPITGMSIAFGMFAVSLLETSFNNQYVILTVEASLASKSGLMQLIYDKAMKLSPEAKLERSSGDIINHLSVDINRIQNLTTEVQTLFSAPTRLLLGLWSLYNLLGNATWGGIATMLIMIPTNTYLVKAMRTYHRKQMKLKDERTSTVNEMLQNVKSIKLYGWEKPMLDKVRSVRDNKELQNLYTIGVISSFVTFAWTCVPFFVSCSTFAIFAFTSKTPLTPDIIFPALSLFDLISDPIFVIPAMMTALIECSVALSRINSFLMADEIDEKTITKLPKVNKMGDPTVLIKNSTFMWSKENPKKYSDNYDEEANIESSKVALRNINFVARKGELSCIVGRVGSGKSTFLQCVLGALPTIPADEFKPQNITVCGSIAYCSQVPWIMNSSFKENILFGHKFDPEFYAKTIEVCQLLPDLDILPDGDETLVGEKGISLSGGQKARLSLARAIYMRADVYLLDDILSAVDSHVGQKLIDQVLGKDGILTTKTRILATNSIKVLNHSKNISLLSNNEIQESSNFKGIMKNENSELFNLIKEFGRQERSETESTSILSAKSSISIIEEATSEGTSDDTSDGISSSDELPTPARGSDELKGITPLSIPPSVAGDELERYALKRSPRLSKLERKSSHVTIRRASNASFKRRSIAAPDSKDRRTAQKKEKKEKGKVQWSIYLRYAQACTWSGIFIVLSLVVLTVASAVAGSYWLKYWSEKNAENGSNADALKYVSIYALFGIGSGVFTLVRSITLTSLCSIRASKKIHNEMATAVLKSPMSFFETTPMGRVMNRFSQDINKIDGPLPRIFIAIFGSVIKTLFTLAIIISSMPLFTVIIAALSVIYIYYQKYYIVACRDLKRIASISKSPIFGHIQESLNGAETIKAYGQLDRFLFQSAANIDYNQVSAYCLKSVNRWLSTRLQFIGSLIVLFACALALWSLHSDNPMSAGLLGLVMSYALRITSSLSFIVKRSVEIESDVVCCERIFEYCDLKPEEKEDRPDVIEPSINWPSEGTIKFNDYSTRYRENLDPVLKNISLSIDPKEKIGIVGRTGSGKSTFVLSIFRIIEAISGNIEIDSLNTSNLLLNELRKNLSIIPQDAQCINGTIRYNLDPFNEYDDEQIWKSLEMSNLKDHIIKMSQDQELVDEPLDVKISESGLNLSVGQRQLVCLARVLLKSQKSNNLLVNPAKILILDEATSSVDAQTDKIIQETIRSELNGLTILTIAHRLDTIMDNDRILVLDSGEIAEFDKPDVLLKNKGSRFYSLCVDGGYVKQEE